MIVISKVSVYYTVENIGDAHDVKKIKNELGLIKGVTSVSVNDEKNGIAVDFDSTGVRCEKIKGTLDKLGFEIKERKFDNHIM